MTTTDDRLPIDPWACGGDELAQLFRRGDSLFAALGSLDFLTLPRAVALLDRDSLEAIVLSLALAAAVSDPSVSAEPPRPDGEEATHLAT